MVVMVPVLVKEWRVFEGGRDDTWRHQYWRCHCFWGLCHSPYRRHGSWPIMCVNVFLMAVIQLPIQCMSLVYKAMIYFGSYMCDNVMVSEETSTEISITLDSEALWILIGSPTCQAMHNWSRHCECTFHTYICVYEYGNIMSHNNRIAGSCLYFLYDVNDLMFESNTICCMIIIWTGTLILITTS